MTRPKTRYPASHNAQRWGKGSRALTKASAGGDWLAQQEAAHDAFLAGLPVQEPAEGDADAWVRRRNIAIAHQAQQVIERVMARPGRHAREQLNAAQYVLNRVAGTPRTEQRVTGPDGESLPSPVHNTLIIGELQQHFTLEELRAMVAKLKGAA